MFKSIIWVPVSFLLTGGLSFQPRVVVSASTVRYRLADVSLLPPCPPPLPLRLECADLQASKFFFCPSAVRDFATPQAHVHRLHAPRITLRYLRTRAHNQYHLAAHVRQHTTPSIPTISSVSNKCRAGHKGARRARSWGAPHAKGATLRGPPSHRDFVTRPAPPQNETPPPPSVSATPSHTPPCQTPPHTLPPSHGGRLVDDQ